MLKLSLTQLSKEVTATREFAARANANVSVAETAFRDAAIQAVAEAAGFANGRDAEEAMYFEGKVEAKRGYGADAKVHNVNIIFAPRISASISKHSGDYYIDTAYESAESKSGRYVSLDTGWKEKQLPASVQDAYARVRAACKTVLKTLEG